MKLKTFKITNFRGYKEETVIDFDNLTAFVGKNDVGNLKAVKSTLKGFAHRTASRMPDLAWLFR